MSGELDANFNYVYKGSNQLNSSKQSNRPLTRPLPPTPPSTAKIRSILASTYLDPAAPYHTTPRMDTEDARLDLARIVAMQLKPELLVEQLMIENRLRCMNLENHQQLNLEGVGVDPKSIHQLDKGAWLRAVKSKSTPALGSMQANSHRKSRRRRNMPNHPVLDWCALNPSTEDLLSRRSHFTSDGKVYVGVDTSQPQTTRYRLPQLHYTLDVFCPSMYCMAGKLILVQQIRLQKVLASFKFYNVGCQLPMHYAILGHFKIWQFPANSPINLPN